MARTIWSPLARRRLAEIIEFIAADSPAAAAAMHATILRAIRRVSSWPLSAPWVGTWHPQLAVLDQSYRLLVVRPYVIFYRVRDGDVQVLTVQHGAQLPPTLRQLGMTSEARDTD
jgi:plasmid stabilization system protein ParE